MGFFLIKLALITHDLGVVSGDEFPIERALVDSAAAADNRLVDYRIGRIYADLKFDLLEGLLGMAAELRSVLRAGAMLLAVLAMGAFVRGWTRSGQAALLVVVAATGWFAISYSYQTYLSFPTYWLAWAAVWMMGVFALRPDGAASRIGLVSAFAVALTIHESNAVFILWPVIIKWARGENWGNLATWRGTILCGVILACYALFILWVRGVAGGHDEVAYQGGVLSWDLKEAWFALSAYTLSGWPGLDSWISPTEGGLLLFPGAWAERLARWLTVTDLVGAIVLGMLFGWLLWAEKRGEGLGRRWWVGWLVLGYVVVAPNLLLSFTPKYQLWAHQRMWPYYFTSMSYLAWVAIIVVSFRWLVGRITSRTMRRWVVAACALVAMLTAVGAAAATREAAARFAERPFTHRNAQ